MLASMLAVTNTVIITEFVDNSPDLNVYFETMDHKDMIKDNL